MPRRSELQKTEGNSETVPKTPNLNAILGYDQDGFFDFKRGNYFPTFVNNFFRAAGDVNITMREAKSSNHTSFEDQFRFTHQHPSILHHQSQTTLPSKIRIYPEERRCLAKSHSLRTPESLVRIWHQSGHKAVVHRY
jgi:hypothetical protein